MFHAGEIADCLKPGSMAPCEPHMHMMIKSPFKAIVLAAKADVTSSNLLVLLLM